MIVDLFAGPGGWDRGCANIGIHDVLGLEYDDAACATRYAAGHKTWQVDIASVTVQQIEMIAECLGVRGLIGSPPCPAFSAAGKRGGMSDMDALIDHVQACADGEWFDLPDREWEDNSSRLTLEPLRWALTMRPTWVALEQVPPVLPIWQAIARVLEANGWSTWTGVLNAADFGVPQTRRRAILMAHRGRSVAPPEPTHDESPQPTLFGAEQRPWVTMADALGWGRSPLDGGSNSRRAMHAEIERGEWVPDDAEVGFPRLDDRGDSTDGYRERDFRSIHEPAFNLTEKARSWTVRSPSVAVCGPRCEPGAHDPWSCQAASPSGVVPSRAWDRGDWQAAVHAAGELNRAALDLKLVPGGSGYNDPNRRLYDLDEPAPTIGFGHDAAGWAWVEGQPSPPGNPVLNTGRDWKPGGTRADAQKIDPSSEPAPNLTAKSGGQWIVHDRDDDIDTNICGHLDPDTDRYCRLAPHTTGNHKSWNQQTGEGIEWPHDRQGIIDGDTDTVPEGAEWTEGRPATTVAGDPRVAQPGHKAETTTPDAPGRMEGAIRITPAQALVLQSFPPNEPIQGSRTKQFEQIGNAVPPGLAAPIISTLDR